MKFHLETPGTNPYLKSGSDRFLYCVWHDSMIIPTFGGKHHYAAALTSHHEDGSFVAEILKSVGMKAIRGSTNHISKRAVRQLLTTAKDRHLVITPDGPRGPYRQMSKGIVYLASRTGRAIVPTAYACSRNWLFSGSWSDLIIPKPFAKVILLAGKPVRVPPDLTREKLQGYVAKVQTEMDRLEVVAGQLAAAGNRQIEVNEDTEYLDAA